MEGWIRKCRLKSTEPIRKWSIEVRGRTNSEKDSNLLHYNDNQVMKDNPYQNIQQQVQY